MLTCVPVSYIASNFMYEQERSKDVTIRSIGHIGFLRARTELCNSFLRVIIDATSSPSRKMHESFHSLCSYCLFPLFTFSFHVFRRSLPRDWSKVILVTIRPVHCLMSEPGQSSLTVQCSAAQCSTPCSHKLESTAEQTVSHSSLMALHCMARIESPIRGITR